MFNPARTSGNQPPKLAILAAVLVFGIILGSQLLGPASNSVAKEAGVNAKLQTPDLEVATLAGGCFWCVESDLEKVPGVVEVVSGFAGGKEANPTYKQVSAGKTGHLEAVQVHYDPKVTNYAKVMDAFWKHMDPTDDGGQFVDRGHQYSTAVFYHTEEQKQLAEAGKKALQQSGIYDKPVVTPILPFTTFYPAEDYHQDYYEKNPLRYRFYRANSGRDSFIRHHWEDRMNMDITPRSAAASEYSKPGDEELRNMLSPMQYKVTQEDGTEPPFNNLYFNNKQEGIYVDVVSGEPLFASTHKFDSGTGWPSFWQPLEQANIVEKSDRKFFMTRTEVRSKHGDSHLGHVFNDGPEPTGLRYCINSASLRFVPKEDLEKEGYGKYLKLFD